MMPRYQQMIPWIFALLAHANTFTVVTTNDKIVDLFVYAPKKLENSDIQQWEYFVVGRRVPWNEAHAICPIYGHQKIIPAVNASDSSNKNDRSDNASGSQSDDKLGCHLATLDEDTKDWLARMLAESNYRYDGLWIGGQRTNVSSNWTWIAGGKQGEAMISDSVVKENYPSWYEKGDLRNTGKNCLVFDRMGHDVPTFVPENCRVRKPFICMRPGKKKKSEKIVEGAHVVADGQRYTLYQVLDDDDDEHDEDLRLAGVRKLNGGGIKWREAKLECQKRGQYLAMVFTNEAAEAIASAMLKSRPSVESAWLGGWSADGLEWTWISSGFSLPAEKSLVTSYPPWLKGHPVSDLENSDVHERKGRCLILDRHLCPEHREPVFLDLNCEKKRPFVCQDALPDHRLGYEADVRIISVNNKKLLFSESPMSWKEGDEYCHKMSGLIASITDTKTLSAVLDKMTELSVDHTWVSGHTKKTKEGWKWLDENGEVLSENGIALSSSWCLEKEDGSFHADGETCLNLDREGHGLPLFYGLPCNATDQYVLCNLTPRGVPGKEDEAQEDEKKEEKENAEDKAEENAEEKDKTAEEKEKTAEENERIHDEETEEDNDLLKDLITRIRKLADYEQSGLLFVMDDSISVLNTWFATQLQFAAEIIGSLFPLSAAHPMGLITFSKRTKLVLDLKQTEPCSVLSFLSEGLLANRSIHSNNSTSEIANKTTDIINAAHATAAIVAGSNLKRVMIIFLTDGEHVTEESDKKYMSLAIQKLNSLKNYGHSVIGIVIRQGEDPSTNYKVVEDLFGTSLNGEKNLYFIKDYTELANITSSLRTATDANYIENCGETKWIVPKDDELLTHLLGKK